MKKIKGSRWLRRTQCSRRSRTEVLNQGIPIPEAEEVVISKEEVLILEDRVVEVEVNNLTGKDRMKSVASSISSVRRDSVRLPSKSEETGQLLQS